MERSGWAALPCSSFRVTPGNRVRYSWMLGVPDWEVSSPGTIWITAGMLESGSSASGRRAGAKTLSAGSRMASSWSCASFRSCWASSLKSGRRSRVCCACDGCMQSAASSAASSKTHLVREPEDIGISLRSGIVPDEVIGYGNQKAIVQKTALVRKEPEGHDVLAEWLQAKERPGTLPAPGKQWTVSRHRYDYSMSPRRMATATACVRSKTPRVSNRRCTYCFTVLRLQCMRTLMSLLLRPSASKSNSSV